MADWHVSDTDSDEEDGHPSGASNFLGMKIDREKVLELLQAVETRKTLELDCLCRVNRKEHRHRPKKGDKGKRRKRAASPGDIRSGEEVSESTSEVRSTHTASTATECRDMRRPTLSTFDYQHEEDFPVLGGKLKKRKPPPKRDHVRGQYIAKLDNVVAEMRREKEQQKWNREENGEGTGGETDPELPFQMTKAGPNNFSAMNSHGGGSNWQDGRGGGGAGGGGVKRTVRLSFEDGDSDLGSPTSEHDGMSSQINRVEHILDAEGFS